MDRLRSPGGCPWDAEQTHASLVPYLVEETYEAVEAIERRGVGEHRLLRRDQHVDHVVGPQLGQWIHRLGSYPLTVTPGVGRWWPA